MLCIILELNLGKDFCDEVIEVRRRILLAVIFCLILLLGFYFFFRFFTKLQKSSSSKVSMKKTITPKKEEKKFTLVKLADTPKVETYNNYTLFPQWGWWVRLSNKWVQFTFENIDTSDLVRDDLIIEFLFGVTNRMDGEKGLDGLVDVVVNPGEPDELLISNVLLDNKDPENRTYPMRGKEGTYRATGKIVVNKKYVKNGRLVIRILRHVDNSKAPPCAGKIAKIDMTDPESPKVPMGVYENNDPKTIHINVYTNPEGTVAKEGIVVVKGYKI